MYAAKRHDNNQEEITIMSKSVYADNHLVVTKQNDAWTNLFELIPDNSRVLDIGCSSGNFGAELKRKKNCTVFGIDIFEDDLKLAKKQLNKVYRRNIEQDEIGDLGTFDVILMADVIEHLFDPSTALKKVAKQLNKNGRFVFSVPNMANIATRLELLKGRFEYTAYGLLDETHVHYYDKPGLERVFTNAGMSVQVYNNTVRDIPQRIIDKFLDELGLMPSVKFYELTNHIDAITFQFIGYAVPSNKPHAHVKSKTPYDFMSAMFDDQYERNSENSKDIEKLKKENEQLDIKAKTSQEELRKIYESKSWKVVDKFHTIAHRLRGN